MKRFFNLEKETIGQSALLVIFFAAMQRVLQTARGVVFARLLGPESYGVYTLAFFFIPLVAFVARLGVPSALNRYVPRYEERRQLRSFLRRTYMLLSLSCLILGTVVFLTPNAFSRLLFGSPQYSILVRWCAACVIPVSVVEALQATFNGLRSFKMASMLRFGQFLLFSLLGITLVVFFPEPEMLLVSYLVSLAVSAIVFVWILAAYTGHSETDGVQIDDPRFYRRLFAFSIWFALSPVIDIVFNYTDRWMIGHLLSMRAVGLYSIGLNVSGLVFTFGTITGTVLLPNLSHLWETNQQQRSVRQLNLAARVNSVLLFGVAAALSLLKRPLITLLFGIEYVQSTGVINILLVYWLCHSNVWTMGTYAQLKEKTYIPLLCTLIGLVVNILLNLFLIPRLGIAGAAMATTGGYIVILAATALWLRREGLVLQTNTGLLFLLPLLLLLPGIVQLCALAALLLLGLRTEILLTNAERAMVMGSIHQILSKLRQRRKSK